MITGPRRTVKLARKLRSEMSLPETLLWREFRKRPEGFKFRRQHPAGQYVLDFYCASVKLAIEVDGAAHDSAEAAARDAGRSKWLRSKNVATLRIPARIILGELDAAVLRVVEVCRERAVDLAARRGQPLHQPAAGPPPRNGED